MSGVLLDLAMRAKDVAAPRVESAGTSSPLGATVVPGGVNFSAFSRNASGVELLLFEKDDPRPGPRNTLFLSLFTAPDSSRLTQSWYQRVPPIVVGKNHPIA